MKLAPIAALLLCSCSTPDVLPPLPVTDYSRSRVSIQPPAWKSIQWSNTTASQVYRVERMMESFPHDWLAYGTYQGTDGVMVVTVPEGNYRVRTWMKEVP